MPPTDAPEPDRTVLITGASVGIGQATAGYLAGRGFRVFAGYRAEDVRDALVALSPNVIPVRLDVTDASDVATAVRAVAEATGGRLDGLVNNAGIAMPGPLEGLPLEKIRALFEVNVFGVLQTVQECLPLLRAARGRIVNVSSINGRIAMAFNAPYAASKFALEAVSDGLRLELHRWGIHVSVIQPGATQSEIWERSWRRAIDNFETLRPEARDHYAGVARKLRERGPRPPSHAVPAHVVAEKVHHALVARRPKTRYLVGRDARLGAFLKWLTPDRLADRVLLKRRR